MLLARFLQDRRGGVAPLLALSIIPIMGAVATSVDYSRAAMVHSSMQSSLDAAGLMLSKNAKDLDSGALNAKATEYFKAVFVHPEAKNVAVTIGLTKPSEGSFKLALTGTATVDTLFGRSRRQIEGRPVGQIRSRVGHQEAPTLALALDNTGSMTFERQDDRAEDRRA